MISYLFTDNIPNKNKLLDNPLECTKDECNNKTVSVYTGAIDNAEFENEDKEQIEGEVSKDTEGNYVFLSKMPIINELISREDEKDSTHANDDGTDEDDFKITGATHVYASGMTIVGLFILYRLMMRYK